MTIYNANVSNIRRSVVDAVSPENCEPYENTTVQPIAWQMLAPGGPFALQVYDGLSIAQLVTVNATLAAVQGLVAPSKTIIYSSPANVAIPAGVPTVVAADIDLQNYRWARTYVANTGAGAITAWLVYAYDVAPLGADAYYSGQSFAVGIAAGLCGSTQSAIGNAGEGWQPGYTTWAVHRYFAVYVTAAPNPTTARVRVVGMR